MTFEDITIQTEGSGMFSKKLGKTSAEAFKQMAAFLMKNPGKELKVGEKIVLQLYIESLKQL